MAYIVPINGASSTRNAIKARFMKADEDCLIVGKSNRLELYTQSPDGLILQHSKAIYGTITILRKLPNLDSASTDVLFVGTDCSAYFTVRWDPANSQLRTERKYIDLSDASLRDAQHGDRCLVDPSGNFLTLEVYEGIVNVIPLATDLNRRVRGDHNQHFAGGLGEPLQVRIEELTVRSSTFLDQDPAQTPRMALLFETAQRHVKLRLRDLKYTHAVVPGDGGNTAEFKDIATFDKLELELGASALIPVPRPVGGLLVLGESSITYIDMAGGGVITEPLSESTVFVAWEQIDGQRWLLADDYGRLFFLMLVLDVDNAVETWKVDLLGETSRAAVLVYLDNGVVFVGSHQGDSQVIQITEGKFDVIQTISNIAPILDFTIMDLGDRSGEAQEFSLGQTRIVAGCGAFNNGSLRSIRSGVGIEDLGVLAEMQHIADLWGFRTTCPEPFSDTLLVSFVNESRIFHFSNDGEVEEKEELFGLILSESTLLAANLPNNRLLQVTEHTAQIIDLESGMVTWTSAHEVAITSASANDDFLMLVAGGTELICVSLSTLERIGKRNFESDNQVSGITITASPVQACIVCLPQTAEIVILNLSDLTVQNRLVLGTPGEAIPRSVIVAEILPNQLPTLFVSMADGTVFSFSYDVTQHTIKQLGKITLGSEQPSFKKLPRGDGLFNVFAACDHPSLIYASDGRIVYSAVNSDSASRICNLNAEAYPGSIAICTQKELKIAIVDKERTTQIHTLPMNATVRRVAYSASRRVFGLGTTKRTIKKGVETVVSSFILADEVMFRPLSTFDFPEDELVESVILCPIVSRVDGAGDNCESDYFAVGTAYLDDVGDDSVRGRILLFEITQARELSCVAEVAVKGACRALALMKGDLLVAALIKSVVIYGISRSEFGEIKLVKHAAHRTSTAPVDVSVTLDTVIVADLMKSVSILEYRVSGEGVIPKDVTLVEVARHYQSLWTTAVAPIENDTYLAGDAEGNLIVLRRNSSGVTVADQRRLQTTSEIRLGEMVNQIHPITIQKYTDAVVSAKALLATVDGSIYLFGLVNPSHVNLLLKLQVVMSSIAVTPGEIPFNKYRGYRSTVRQSDEPFRFVDGELIEKFLTCPSEVQGDVVSRLDDADVTVATLKEMIEQLRRMH